MVLAQCEELQEWEKKMIAHAPKGNIVFSVARSLIKNGLNIDLGKIKDVSSLAKEIARVEGKNE